MHYGPMLIDILIRSHSLLVVFQSIQEGAADTYQVREICQRPEQLRSFLLILNMVKDRG